MATPRTIRHLLLGLVLACVLTACGGGGGGGGSGGGTPPPPPTWTVLVYAHADHNLSPSLLVDLAEMTVATIGPHVRVLVLADWDSSQGYPSGYEWLRVHGNGVAPDLLLSGPESDFDSPTMLAYGIEQAFTQFPADRYGLVLWDHGGAWDVGFGGDTQNGTAPGNHLGIEAMAAAIRTGLDAAGLTGSRPLAWLGTDTCLLMGAETVHAVRDLAEVYLGCAEIDYGAGWDYAGCWSSLSAHAAESSGQMASRFVAHYRTAHTSGLLADALTHSHAAIDLTQWHAFTDAYQDVSLAVAATTTDGAEDVARTGLQGLPGYGKVLESRALGQSAARHRDIGRWLDTVATDGPAGTTTVAATARARLASCQIASTQGLLRAGANQSGLHVEWDAPVVYTQSDGIARLSAYDALTWTQDAGHGAVLQRLATAADLTAPVVVVGGGPLLNPTTAAPAEITLSLVDSDVALAEVDLAADLGGGVWIVHGSLGGGEVTAGDWIFEWNGKAVYLSDGITLTPCWVRPFLRGSGPTLYAIRGLYGDGIGAPVVADLIIDQSLAPTPLLLTQDDGRVTALALSPGSFFQPVMRQLTGGTPSDAPQATLTIPANGQLSPQELAVPNGTYHVLIGVEDVWGNLGVDGETATVAPAGPG